MRITLCWLALVSVAAGQDSAADLAARRALETFRKSFRKPGVTEDAKVAALKKLAKVPHPEVARSLAGCLFHQSLAVRIQSARVLGGFSKIRRCAGEVLSAAFSDERNGAEGWSSARITILQEIGKLEYVAGADVVNAAVSHTDGWIAKAAVDATGKLRQKSSIEALLRELRQLEGDAGRKKVDADPLSEDLTSGSLDPMDVIKYHDQKKGAPRERREVLQKPIQEALHKLTRMCFRSVSEWETWWQRAKSRFEMPR